MNKAILHILNTKILQIATMLLAIFAISYIGYSQMYIANGANLYLNQGATLSVVGSLNIASGGAVTHNTAGVSTLWMSGVYSNFGTYTQGNFGRFRFYGNLHDSIAGPSQTFQRLWISKSGSNMVSLAPGTNVTINQHLRLISNNILNIHRSNLIIEPTAMIYPDSISNYTTDPLLDPFLPNKFIMTSGEKNLSGAIVRKLPETASLNIDLSVRFPIGTPLDTANPTVRNYSPTRYVFNAGEATIGTNAHLTVRCIASEHQAVEVQGVSLKKYWDVTYNNINVAPGGYNVRFNYNDNEVLGFEELYMLCLFFRPYDGPNGTYYINSGAGYGVEPVNNRFYVDEVNQKDTLNKTLVLLDGQWTAGQAEAVSTYYYSRVDGDWYNANTWSKQGYNGEASNTFPTTINDKVYIGNGRTVSLASATANISSIRIENTGRLLFSEANALAQGDSLFVLPGGTIAISSADGISLAPSALGNVRTTHRSYSQFGKYEYIGNLKQVTGIGIPDIVGSLIVNKTELMDTLWLSKSILVKDSLIINQGTFHLFKNGNFTAHGETGDTTNRFFRMRGGEISIQNFPTKYKNPIFTAGTITFDGTGSFRIPSSVSPGAGEPAVTQYYNMKLNGARGANTYVTLDPSGEIRIGGNLDISGLSFNPTPISDRFIVTGSTVVFNGTSDQSIPTGYTNPTALIYRLKFHNLNIAGSGNKSLLPPNDSNPNDNFVLIRNFVNLRSGNFVSNGHHIKVLNSWQTDIGANFVAGSGRVTFEADGKVTNIRSNGIQFNDLFITGTAINGVVNYLDSTTVGGNLVINPANFRDLNNTALSIRGNFTNQGTFTAGTGRVYFNGTGNQTLSNNGNGIFRNITVNKSSGMVRLEGDSLIRVTNNLTLQQGNIGGRSAAAMPNKEIVVDGTITRPAGTPGHIDGRLRLPTVENANSLLFPIGLGNEYAPMQLDITGFGGAAGYLDSYVLLDLDAPNITRAVIETQLPNGPELDSTKNVRKVWVLNADTTRAQRFQLGAARRYNAEFFFPASNVRNGAITSTFEIYHRDTTVNTGRWKRPELDVRNPLSTKFINNDDLDNNAGHYFILGEPKVFTYFSIADGNWDDRLIWSTASYLSSEPASRPPISNDNIRIGNGKTVTLNVNHSVNSNRIVVVETGARDNPNGHLVFGNDTRLLTGEGTFRLDSGGAITIRHSEGITTSGASGCIRTTTRQYNFNNHNSGHFIYARNGNQATGNGFPATVRTLQMNTQSGTLSFTGTSPVIRQVVDSLYLASGNANLSTVIMKVGGNFVIDNGASFTPGTQRVSNLGSNGANNNADTVTWTGVIVFNGNGVQRIRGSFSDASVPLVFNRLSISKPNGVVISHFNVRTSIFWLKHPNRAFFDVATFDKYLNVYDPEGGVYGFGRRDIFSTTENNATMPDPLFGYVAGRLIRFIATNESNRYFPIGTGTRYSPLILNRNEVGGTGGQVSGLLEIQSVNGNHPSFNPAQINPNTNIQRYYEITRPVGLTPAYTQGDRALTVNIFFTRDERRGGINALNYSAFRLVSGNNWSRTANISTTNDSATALRAFPNNPTLGGNNIFSVPSQFTATNAIVIMIGEAPPPNPERVFYSIKSGNWTDPNTWAYSPVLYENTENGYVLTTNTVNDYPRRTDGTSRDFAIIGNGHTVTLDTSAFGLQYVLVEQSANGIGHLIMPDENHFRTNQYVQKNGGKLSIGSRYGITNFPIATTNPGNIRRLTDAAILNYDWTSLGINNFAYIGASSNNIQNTGPALPNSVASLEINYNRSAADRYVDLTNNENLTIRNNLVFINGRLRNRDGNRTITIFGDIINNSTDVGFHNQTTPSNRTVFLSDTLNQRIRGSAAETRFPQTVRIEKTNGNITSEKNIRFDGIIQFYSNIRFDLNDNTTLTFGENAVIDSLERFSSQRLFKVSGGANTARLRKVYPVGTSTQTFTFPIGEDALGTTPIRYGEARFTLTNQTYSANNYLELALRAQYPHPNAPTATPNMLGKYWNVTTSGISLATGSTSARFRYNDADIRGNILNYRPSLYRRSNVEPNDPGWSFELFNATNLQIDTTNKFIIVANAITLPNHDWTAGDPASFSQGRTFWSIANGDWSKPTTWTNFNNSGSPHTSTVPSLNSPGFFPGDTVLIGSNHIVNFDKTPIYSIDSLGVGVVLSTAPELRFNSSAGLNKSLFVKGNATIGQTGLISKDNSSGNSYDTLYILKNFQNNGNAGRGVAFRPTANRKIQFSFIGNLSSFIIGNGNYTSLASVRVLKSDSIFNLHNESSSFSTRFSESVLANPDVNFQLDAGMYYHNNPADITLSTDGDGDVFLGDLVGLAVQNGNVIYSDGLICGQNASVWLLNGNLTIGNAKNENFQYESTTIIDIQGNSKLSVAGSMRRRFLTSNVDFRLKDNALIEVMVQGAVTNSAERRAAFDFGESSSLFTMTGGQVLIYRPMELNLASEKDPDYYVTTSTSTVTGGKVQFGDPALTIANAHPFDLIASTPFWNVDIANTYGKDIFLSSPIVTINNDLTIRDNGILNQNGNNLNIGGNFTNNGIFRTGTIGPRRLSFFGNDQTTPPTKLNQIVRVKNSGNDPFFDLVINKAAGGNVTLTDDPAFPHSNFIVRNTLEFSISNTGLIATGNNRFVQVGTTASDLASIQRFGQGHVNGELRRWINDGAQVRLFTIGTNLHYTPAQVVTSTGIGTPGLLSATAYGISHPDLSTSTLHQPGTSIDRYWRIVPADTFSIGAGRSYSLTLFYRKGLSPAGDQKSGSSFGTFEHFRRTPEWNNPGDWHLTIPDARTDSSTTSRNNTHFGDFVIAEIAGLRFYSRESGYWNDASTWSTTSYSGGVAARIPNNEADRVFIGNGRTVTIRNTNPRVRAVSVEQFNGQAGRLVILDERYLRGLSFELADNCYVATDDAFGFTNVAGPTPNIGAIRTTNIRSFGKATIEYLGSLSQAIGDGPTNPKTLIINNSGLSNKTVSFSTVNYTVEDTIIIKQGYLSMGNSNVQLKGNLITENNTKLFSGSSTLSLTGTNNQYFVMNDSSGISLFNLNLNKPSGNLILSGLADTAMVHISRNLTFATGNTARIDARTNNKRIALIHDTTTITRNGSGHIDGMLLKQFPSGSFSFNYPIGFGATYTPAELTLTAGIGTAGFVSGLVMSPPAFNQSRVDPLKKINYYWILEPRTTFTIGTRTANTLFGFPSSEVSNLTGGQPNSALMLRKSKPNETPPWSHRDFSQLNWNISTASVQINNPAHYWSGLGEFYIGEKYRLIFYSLQNGNWNDHRSWALDEARTLPAPESEFPNPNDEAIRDSVIIGFNGGQHTIRLNVPNPTISGLTLMHDGKLDMHNNGTMPSNTITSPGWFSLLGSSTIAFGGTINPSSEVLRNFAQYIIGDNSTIAFYGTQTISPNPFGFGRYEGNVLINGPGKKIVNTNVLILGNLSIDGSAELELLEGNILTVRKNVVNAANIMNRGTLQIGQ